MSEYGRRTGDGMGGRRTADTENAQAAAAMSGTTWLTRQAILGLVAVVIAIAGAFWAAQAAQSAAVGVRLEALAAAQVVDARDVAALKARSDATDLRLSGMDRKLDSLDNKLDGLGDKLDRLRGPARP